MNKIRLKNNSKKKFNTFPLKFLFLLFIVISSTVVTIKYLLENTDIKSDKYLNYLLSKSYDDNGSNNFVFKEGLKLIAKIDMADPSSLLDNKIKQDKNIKNSESVISKDATSNEDDYTSSAYDKITSYIENPLENKENPIVYIYNSHQLETYSNQGFENNGISPNVLMVSYLLAEQLNNSNINTVVEDTNISEFIRISSLASDDFYASTRIFIKNAMSKYNTLKYYIDIHRDSVNKNISTCTINNKSYARILFVLGTTNPNYKENEKVMKELDSISDELYPGLSRGIYNRATPNWTDAYNQDLNQGVILIEVGAKENTLEEVMNTTQALGEILKRYIGGK